MTFTCTHTHIHTHIHTHTHTHTEQLLLAAPPLLFQQRGVARPCNLTAMQSFLKRQYELLRVSHCIIASDCPNTKSQADIFKCKTQMADVSRHFGLNATSLQGAIGYADFLYTMADNDVIVREETVLPALEFLDTATTSAKIVCLFYSPSNGDTTVLTLYIEVEGTLIKTRVKQAFYGFLDAAQRKKSVYYYAIILGLCVAILVLNLSLLLESNSLCKKYGTITQVHVFRSFPQKRKEPSKNALHYCGNKGAFMSSPPPPYHSLLYAMYS